MKSRDFIHGVIVQGIIINPGKVYNFIVEHSQIVIL